MFRSIFIIWIYCLLSVKLPGRIIYYLLQQKNSLPVKIFSKKGNMGNMDYAV